MQHDYHNPGNGYSGTVSHLGDLAVPNSARRMRGKVRGNKRDPRTRVVALSDVTVYRSRADYDAGKVAFTVEGSYTKATARRRAKAATRAATVLPEASRLTFKDASKLFGTD